MGLRRLFWIPILTCLLGWPGAGHSEEMPTAVLLSYSGSVDLCPKVGAPACKKAGLMRLLYIGDRLSLGEGAEVVVKYLKDGHRERAVGKGQVVLFPEGCRSDGPRIYRGRGLVRLSAPRDKRCIGDSLGTALVRRGPEVETMYTLSPSFSWKGPGGQTLFLLHEGPFPDNALAGSFFWHGWVEGDRFDYPQDAPPLKWGGLYYWRVVPSLSNIDKEVARGAFRLARSEEAVRQIAEARSRYGKAVNAGDVAATAELVLLYLDNELYDEALVLQQKLAALRPDDPSVHYLLAKIYYRQENRQKGDEERALVEKLGGDKETYVW